MRTVAAFLPLLLFGSTSSLALELITTDVEEGSATSDVTAHEATG